jgi:hypothetical protein
MSLCIQTTAVEFVSSVLSGRISTSPMSTRPGIEEGCAASLENTEEVVEDDVDASDFLAEIIAEEKAKAEELKQAAAEAAKKLAEKKKNGGNKKKSTDKKKKKKKSKADEL